MLGQRNVTVLAKDCKREVLQQVEFYNPIPALYNYIEYKAYDLVDNLPITCELASPSFVFKSRRDRKSQTYTLNTITCYYSVRTAI